MEARFARSLARDPGHPFAVAPGFRGRAARRHFVLCPLRSPAQDPGSPLRCGRDDGDGRGEERACLTRRNKEVPRPCLSHKWARGYPLTSCALACSKPHARRVRNLHGACSKPHTGCARSHARVFETSHGACSKPHPRVTPRPGFGERGRGEGKPRCGEGRTSMRGGRTSMPGDGAASALSMASRQCRREAWPRRTRAETCDPMPAPPCRLKNKANKYPPKIFANVMLQV